MGFPGTWLVGARIGDEYVGFAACRTVLYESELLLIAVSSKWRGQHIGDTIIRYIMEKLQKEMVRKLFLEVRINNKAIDFYNRLDFKIIGNRPHYYTSKSGETFNALTMSVDIT